ncbi:MAG: helix-turn-helix transcriptional regulator [Ignavibacterium sp.]|nr:helix-turn-helix transcriptional regulator [Ignavibacterium sp.]
MLKLNANAIFAAKSIVKPNAFLRKNGFTTNTASKIVTGKIKAIQLGRLEKLCLLLNCTPHDILEWEPDTTLGDPKKFEMSKLIKDKKIVVLSEELRGLTLAQVEEVHRFVEIKKNENLK